MTVITSQSSSSNIHAAEQNLSSTDVTVTNIQCVCVHVCEWRWGRPHTMPAVRHLINRERSEGPISLVSQVADETASHVALDATSEQ